MQERGVVCLINKQGYWVNDLGKILHREVCRKENGPFDPRWVVHHCNGDKLDNRKENLVALPAKFHTLLHRSFGFKARLPDRGRTLMWLESFGRNRKKCERTMRSLGRDSRPLEKTRPIEKPAVHRNNCLHQKTEKTMVTFINGHEHIQRKCTVCFKILGYLKKNDNHGELPLGVSRRVTKLAMENSL